jgi:hypothetical protein
VKGDTPAPLADFFSGANRAFSIAAKFLFFLLTRINWIHTLAAQLKLWTVIADRFLTNRKREIHHEKKARL